MMAHGARRRAATTTTDRRMWSAQAAKASGSGKYDGASDIAAGELLVFEKEPDLAAEFARLRIDAKE